MTPSQSQPITFNKSFPIGSSDNRNIFINGDNLEVLPSLTTGFAGAVKCIYIDPPYNNGEKYHYYNDNADSAEWLDMMSATLERLRPFLHHEGSIWISIDDKEMAYLKVAADKIFGRANFVGTIIWEHRKSRENRTAFSCNHEYILVYASDIARFRKSRNRLDIDPETIAKKYHNPDNDPRGPWQSVSASVQAGHAVASQFYTITTPGGQTFNPPKGRCWAYNEQRMKREIADGTIWFGRDGNSTPRIKKYLSTSKSGLTPQTIWTSQEGGTTESAKKHLLALFPDVENVFDTPKPEQLIQRILTIATNENDYVLDCFAGSGTTMATAHKMNRRYIGIEIGEEIAGLAARRLRSVIKGEEPGGISASVGWGGGGDFLEFRAHSTLKPS